MERSLRKPKARIQGHLVREVDATYALHTELNERALVEACVSHGCKSGYGLLSGVDDDPDARADDGDMRQLLRKGADITRGVQKPKCGLIPDDARIIVDAVCHARVRRGVQQRLHQLQDVLRWVSVTAHHSACVPGCLLRSAASPAMLRRKQSSFATARQAALIPLDPGHRRAAAAGAAPPQGISVVYCRAFLCLAPLLGAGARPEEEGHGLALVYEAENWAGDYALVEVPPEQRRSLFVGTPTRSCASVDDSIELQDLWMLPLADIRQQLIMLTERSSGRHARTLRFLEFYADVDL